MELFQKLPKNILFLLFDSLRISDHFNLEMTCKGFKKLIFEKELFKRFYVEMMGQGPEKEGKQIVDWKRLYLTAISETSKNFKF